MEGLEATDEVPPCRQCRFCLGNDSVPQGVSDALRASANNCRPCWTFTDSAWNNAIAIARRFRRGKRRRKQTDQDYHAFITPCACKGSVRFVHKKCLQLWIITNAQQPNGEGHRCPICWEKYSLPRNFMRDLDGKATLGGLRLAEWYFSTCFLYGGIQGLRTIGPTALDVAVSPLFVAGLPLQAVIQALQSKPQAAQTMALACVSTPLLPTYGKLALQASAFVLLRGWCVGGVMGSIMGGRLLLRLLTKAPGPSS